MFRLSLRYERWWMTRFLAPQFEALGDHARINNPWRMEVTGREIRAGKALHVLADDAAPVRLTTWPPPEGSAEIRIGDVVLIIAGTRILAAERIEIGDGTMLAANVTITDSDWHGLYDRTGPPSAKPVLIGRNVWIGDGAFIGKGAKIGDDAVIGARSVVTGEVPPGAVMAGNPARVIKTLNPEAERKTRIELLEDPMRLERYLDGLQREKLARNTLLHWLRVKLAPSRND